MVFTSFNCGCPNVGCTIRRLAHGDAAHFYAALVYGTLSLGAVSFLLPSYWIISTALKADFQIFYPPQWMPNPVVWENFKRAIVTFPWLYARNTMIITVSVVVGQVVTAALVAYGFAKIEWPGRDVVFVFVWQP